MKTFWKAFWCVGAGALVVLLAMYMRSPEAMGIHAIPPNAVVIEGEAVVVNYDATVEEWNKAFAKWQELKK